MFTLQSRICHRLATSTLTFKPILYRNLISSPYSSLEKKQREMRQSKSIKENQAKEQLLRDSQSGQLYPGANQEMSQLSDMPINSTPVDFWRSLLLLQVPQLYYLYNASTSEYFSLSFANNSALLIDSAGFSLALLGGMYFGYAVLKKESYSLFLTPLTLAALGVSMHFAYNLNSFCVIPMYVAQLIQILADYQGSQSGRYPNFILSAKSRFFLMNFIITLLGFFLIQNFLNYNDSMKKLKKQYEERSKELAGIKGSQEVNDVKNKQQITTNAAVQNNQSASNITFTKIK